MSTPNPNARIIDKLRKLLAHQTSAAEIGNTAEAEAFAEKIRELLVAHKIEEFELEESGAAKPEALDVEGLEFDDMKGSARQLAILADVIAEAHCCSVVWMNGRKFVYIAGKEVDRAVTLYMFRQLSRFADEESKRDRRRYRAQFPNADTKNWTGAWLNAFTIRLGLRYQRSEHRESESTALVLLRDAKAAKDALAEKFKVKTTKRTFASHEAAAAAGWAAGERASLSTNGVGAAADAKEIAR